MIKSNTINKLRQIIKEKKENVFFNLNPFIWFFFGVMVLFFISGESIYKFYKKYRYQIIVVFINGIILSPIILLMFEVIDNLPEVYVPIFVFYLMIMLGVILSRNENKRIGEYYRQQQGYYENVHGYKNNIIKNKPKAIPTRLSKKELKKRKNEIRNNLLKNKVLKNKYNL